MATKDVGVELDLFVVLKLYQSKIVMFADAHCVLAQNDSKRFVLPLLPRRPPAQ